MAAIIIRFQRQYCIVLKTISNIVRSIYYDIIMAVYIEQIENQDFIIIARVRCHCCEKV